VSGDVVCTIYDDEADVEVRAAFSDGTDAIRGEFAIR